MTRSAFACCFAALLPVSDSAAQDKAPPSKLSLPAEAEVHAIGVSTPAPAFAVEEVSDWRGLAVQIREARDKNIPGPAQRIADRMFPQARDVLNNPDRAAHIPDYGAGDTSDESLLISQERRSVRKSFMALLDDRDFYDAKAFKGVALNKQITDLIDQGKKRSLLDTQLLNRLLLRAAFPNQMRAKPVDPTAVEVEVTGKGQVVLILTSYNPCRWTVRVDKDVTLVRVIRSSFHPSQVEGVSCPITIVGRLAESGERYSGARYAHETGTPEYDAFEKQMSELTGRKLTSFQGDSDYPGKPYVVKATGR